MAQAAAPIVTPNDATAHAIQLPLPTCTSSSPPGDVYVSMLPYPETTSGETHPLMPMPTLVPSNHAHPEPPPSAALPTMPFRVTYSGDEGSV